MHATIPEQYILTTDLQIPILSYQIDFTVTYTLWGELIAATSLLDTLPINARKMMFGADFSNVRRRMAQLPQLLRYQLPLAMLGYVNSPHLQPAIQAVQIMKKSSQIDVLQLLKTHGQDSWLLFLYNADQRLPEKKLAAIIPQLGILVQGHEKKLFKAVRALQANAPQLIFMPILHALVPFQKNELRRYLYKQIGDTRLLINRDFLLYQLGEETESYLRAKIIDGLSNYTNKTVYERLIKHYKETPWTRGKNRELTALAYKIKQYQNDATITIAKDFLQLHESILASIGREILLQRGYTEAAFVELLPDLFDESLLEVQVDILLDHYLALRDRRLIPPPSQLLQLITLYGQRYPSAGSPMTLFQKLAVLFQKGFQHAHYADIYELLSYNDDRLQRSGLHLLSQLVGNFPFHKDSEIGQKIIHQLFTLAESAWSETRMESLRVLQQLALPHATADWLPTLRALTQHRAPRVATAALTTFIAVLTAHPNLQKGQLHFLVEFLNSGQEDVQKLAVEGLKMYPRQRVEKVIGGLADKG